MKSMFGKYGSLATLCVLSLAVWHFGAARADDLSNLQKVERGRYIAKIAGCNDCHTPKYLMSDGDVPESQWLSGDNFGWNGPWGTTYGSNLRLFVSKLSEDEWVAEARTLKRRPPMPWFNLNAMAEDDLRAL